MLQSILYFTAVSNFDGEKVKDGISLQVGDTVQILEECQGIVKNWNWHETFANRRNIYEKSCITDFFWISSHIRLISAAFPQ